MKTYRNLYPNVCDWDNVYLAYRKARKGKRGRPPAATFEYNLEANLVQLRQELVGKTYTPGKYDSFYIHEPKRRLISAAPFRDRVVQQSRQRPLYRSQQEQSEQFEQQHRVSVSLPRLSTSRPAMPRVE